MFNRRRNGAGLGLDGIVVWRERGTIVGHIIIQIHFNFHFVGKFFALVMERNGVFKLLDEVLIDRFSALENGATIFETLNLLQDKTRCVDFVLYGAVYRNYALLCVLLGLPVGQYFNLGSPGPFDDVLDHVPLLTDEFGYVVGRDEQLYGVVDVFPVFAEHRMQEIDEHDDVGLYIFESSVYY